MERLQGRMHHRRSEEGALLIIIMIGVVVASIGLAAAVQAWSTTWRRDNEEELIFRGKQYVNAILAYRKEHGGQFPLNLEDLYKQGPRRLRYIRKLFKDPIAKGGKWGLLYLAPGGQQVYDPKAAQKAAKKNSDSEWGSDDDGSSGSGVPGTGGPIPGAPQPGGLPANIQPPPLGSSSGNGKEDEERVSEPPLGWPIVGVISRAAGAQADKTFATYKGHEKVDEWQFNSLEIEGQQPQVPGNQRGARSDGCVGPGFGGQCAGGIGGPRPGRGPGGGNQGTGPVR